MAPSTSIHLRQSSFIRGVSSTDCSWLAKARQNWIRSSSLKVIWMWRRWLNLVFTIVWPRWARQPREIRPNCCSVPPVKWFIALTVTRLAKKRPGVHWKPHCLAFGKGGRRSFCSCPTVKTPIPWCEATAPWHLKRCWMKRSRYPSSFSTISLQRLT